MFKTPLPNSALWNGQTIGLLSSQDAFTDGGWWHDNRILAATGEGIDKEEPKAWEGWWNDNIVDLVRLSIKQSDALCVLLTGRSEKNFGDLVKRIVASKGLEFDMVSLKPRVSPTNQRFQSTMHFKQLFLNALMETYKDAAEIKIYEDRPKHTKGFRDFFEEWNRRQRVAPTRGPLSADVVQVAEIQATLQPVTEVAEVQRMINAHNEALKKRRTHTKNGGSLHIKKSVFSTAYNINPADTRKLQNLIQIPADVPAHELIYHGNNIMISPRTCPPDILEKVGGVGAKMKWEVITTGCYENNVWAAGLRPVPQSAKFHTANPMPLVVLALRKGSKPVDAGKISKWCSLSPEQMFTFETVVGEKVILRVEREETNEDGNENLSANKSGKRKHPGDDDRRNKPANGPGPYGGQTRGMHTGSRGGRGRGAGGKGFRGSRGGGRGGRGRGGPGFGYRSLDDVDPKGPSGGSYAKSANGRGAGGQAPGSAADLQNYY